ncbi:unnamed protein product [Rodentolepis nana]|uniref:Glycos_transf_1 domain-containing protein n=1 Tax=Rodentolepis nana TaxID=102285 RepID=A0A0R3T4Z0_RODNA|nr:unnamed protein product [Rodentolepis nana]
MLTEKRVPNRPNVRIILISKSDLGSGNFTTMQRIKKGINDLKEQDICVFQMGLETKSINERLSETNWNGLTILIGLNIDRTAFLSSYVSSNTKLVFICGGTDVNESVKNPTKLQRMSEAITRSSATVAFGVSLKKQFLSFWPEYKGLLRIIPQTACVIEPTQIHCKSVISSLESKLAVTLESFILFAGRLRPIKDPAYSLKPFLRLAEDRRDLHLQLLFVGSVVSGSYFVVNKLFLGRVLYDSVQWVESIPQSDLHALMASAICLINSSLSEGQALSIIEAMALGCPVVARHIPGNVDLIEHEKTGLLYDSQEGNRAVETFRDSPIAGYRRLGLKECFERLLDDHKLRSLISRNARMKSRDALQYHKEANSYLNLIDEILRHDI